MADQNISNQDQSALNIPEETQVKFTELIRMIKDSPSMDHEERQYWVDVLPIMTEDQITNLRSILANEQEQIAEVNKKYATDFTKKANETKLYFNELEYKEKKRIIYEAERLAEQKEKKNEESLLKELENI